MLKRFLLIALGLHIAFGTMCTMAFAEMPFVAPEPTCQHEHHELASLPAGHAVAAYEQSGGCCDGSCITQSGSERAAALGFSPSPGAGCSPTSLATVTLPFDETIAPDVPQIAASPPHLSQGTVLRE